MRLEYKFLVRNDQLENLRKKFIPFVEKDPFINGNSNNEYSVHSIYFDSSGFNFYHEKIEGYKIRKKLRIRSYGKQSDNNLVFLEIKNKYNNFIGKNRAPLQYQDLTKLLSTKSIETYAITNNGCSNAIRDVGRFIYHIYKNDLKPVILIVYEREAYFSKFDKNLRITFDKNLRFTEFPQLGRLFNSKNMETALPNHFVLELKFNNGYPLWVQKIISEFNLCRRSVSKYTICIDASKRINPSKKNLISSDILNLN